MVAFVTLLTTIILAWQDSKKRSEEAAKKSKSISEKTDVIEEAVKYLKDQVTEQRRLLKDQREAHAYARQTIMEVNKELKFELQRERNSLVKNASLPKPKPRPLKSSYVPDMSPWKITYDAKKIRQTKLQELSRFDERNTDG